MPPMRYVTMEWSDALSNPSLFQTLLPSIPSVMFSSFRVNVAIF